jgi:aryl-alcohol dehydrogenase-like predicted oxidoreductase
VTLRNGDPSSGARRLAFGVSGPLGLGLVSADHVEALVIRAFELGIRDFDTGPSYGDGEAERRLGLALKRLPGWGTMAFTKAGIQSGPVLSRTRDFTPDGVVRSIEASLKRLNRPKIDRLFLHGPSPGELTDGLFKLLIEEKFSGRVGIVGIAGRGAELDAALETGIFSSFMTPVHPGLNEEQKARLTRLRSAGVEIIGIETIGPHLARLPLPFSPGNLWRNAKTLAGRSAPRLPRAQRLTPAQAVVWALTTGGADRVVITTTKINHLEQVVAAVSSIRRPRLIGD